MTYANIDPSIKNDDECDDHEAAMAWVEYSIDNVVVLGPIVADPGDPGCGCCLISAAMEAKQGFRRDHVPFETIEEVEEFRASLLRGLTMQPMRVTIFECSTELAFALQCQKLWPCPQADMLASRASESPGAAPGEVRVVENASLTHHRYVKENERAAVEAMGWIFEADLNPSHGRYTCMMRWVGFGVPPEPAMQEGT